MGKRKIRKEQILCLSAGILLALLNLFSGEEGILKRDGGRVLLERPGYGEAETCVEVQVKSSGGEKETLKIVLNGQTYTEEEAQALFCAMDEEVLRTMLGANANQMEVRTDLCFPTSLEDYPAVTLRWSNDAPDLIGEDGKVANTDLTEPRDAVILLRSSVDGQSRETDIPVRIQPAPERLQSAGWKERLEKMLAEADENTKTERMLVLPEEFEGEKISYGMSGDFSFLLFPALGFLSAVLLELKPKEDEKKKKKERETELLIDYSEIISKLIVYIGAGLTVRNAFHQLAESYRKLNGPVRAVYEEILTADQELTNGEPESEVYLRFARRCDLKCYVRMVSLLEQNRKTGDSTLLVALELEMSDAFEQRKNVARRLGEEAGTKLMAPLIISLITVLTIVVVPALTQMG